MSIAGIGVAVSFPFHMNLNKTIDLLGSMQTLLAVLDRLPDPQRGFVLQTMKCNGLDHELLSRQTVKSKHALQAIPPGQFEPMVTMSSLHVPLSVREALVYDRPELRAWGLSIYSNEYGAFICIERTSPPSENAPASLKAIYGWARDIDICWIKLDIDAAPIDDLPVYGDVNDVVQQTQETVAG